MSEERILSRRATVVIVAVCSASLLTGLLLGVLSADKPERPGADAHGYSTSAIGHRGLIEVLREVGVPVVQSRWETARLAADASLLVLAEPDAGDDVERRASLPALLAVETPTLLVLPKWRGWESWERRGWVDDVDLRPIADVERVLSAAGIDAEVVRPEGDARRVAWVDSRFGVAPTLAEPQLLARTALTPLVHGDRGVLLGETTGPGGQRLVVLSDPDVLSNHGLLAGRNAALAAGIVAHLRFLDRAVVVDETLHGFERPASLWAELFAFPLVLVVLAFALSVALLLWATVGRFGAPRPPPPAHGSGVAYLVSMSARLLVAGGHARFALVRYADDAVQAVARRLGARDHRTPGETVRWLHEVGVRRGVSVDLDALTTHIASLAAGQPRRRQILQAARRVYRWRQEMLHGS